MQRTGICTLGNLINDIIHHVRRYPGSGELTNILGEREKFVGGLACNTALVLSMLDAKLPIMVAGVLGDDSEGAFIRSQFARQQNIDTSRIIKGSQTAYTVVINDSETNQRTFFTSCGSGDDFTAEDIDLTHLPARILHAGYILLMAGLDREDADYGTGMARLLSRAKNLGIKTSVDVVSESGNRFRRLVPPALRYTDYCIINELEAQQITGQTLRGADGTLHEENMEQALKELKAFGVSAWAVIHCPEGAYGLDETNQFVSLPSLKLPSGYIKGTTGAGDAFCSGVLYGAHEGWSLVDSLRLGTAGAALSLSAADSYSAVRPAKDCLAFYRDMGGQ